MSVRALIEEKIIQKRTTKPNCSTQNGLTYSSEKNYLNIYTHSLIYSKINFLSVGIIYINMLVKLYYQFLIEITIIHLTIDYTV